MEVLMPEKLIVYDGHCVICNASVHYIFNYDKTNSIHFANSESKAAEHLKNESNIEFNADLSVVFYSDDRLYFQSDAVIEVSRHLRFPFNLLKYFRFIPKGFRDWVYQLIANNRYRIFRRRQSCIIPDKELQKRIVD
jgi:predicted DCC family thiol-disulfide oxidoreductase YuxK